MILASTPELREAFSQPGVLELVVEIDKLKEDYNRLEEQYKLLINELQCLKE